MKYPMLLLSEAAVVGLVLGGLLALTVSFFPLKAPSAALYAGILLGAGVHLMFELLGLNARYCSTGAACARIH